MAAATGDAATKIVRVLIVLLLVFGTASTAYGHGGFPVSVDTDFVPGDNQTILLGTNFGLLLSRDDGASFYWVCEEALGAPGLDPEFAATANGTLVSTLTNGLTVSIDGCTWIPAPELDGHVATDVFVAPADNSVWVTTGRVGGGDVFVSADNAQTFTVLGMGVADAWWTSVRVAPSDAQRVYVSGSAPGPTTDAGLTTLPLLQVSNDGGVNFTPLSFTGTQRIHVLAVSPTDPDVLFVREEGDAGDTLYRSIDGGVAFTQVLTVAGQIRDVYIWPDGQRVLVASVIVTSSSFDPDAVNTSTDGGVSFTQVGDATGPQMTCIARRDDGEFFSCGDNWDPDLYTVGRSTDTLAWQPVTRFVEIVGPVECGPQTSVGSLCQVPWEDTCRDFGICAARDAGPEPDAAGPAPSGGCGCGIGMAIVPMFWWRRRRRAALVVTAQP